MQKPLAGEYAVGYQEYFDLVPQGEYSSLLNQNTIETISYFEAIAEDRLDYKYAADKWTIKEVFMHIIDTERVFSYRGLVAARGDESPHYRMDERLYAGNVDVSRRSVTSLLAEFNAVRTSTQFLYDNLSDAQSKRLCNIVTHPMTARAIGYFLIGHVKHHLNIIEQRYL